MRNLPILVLLVGATACGGTDPSASGVFPTAGFLGRSVRVEISGDATEWGASAKVSFGEGITVDSVTVASPTALFADITIADNAPIGLRDVVVTGGDNVTLKSAFEIESPITITLRGSLAQGSIAAVDVVNHDFDTPFDTTSTGDGLFSPLVFTNITATAGNGVRVLVDNVSPYGLSATLLIDTDAQTGPLSFTSGPAGGETLKFPLGADMAIAARTAMPLTAGTNATATSTKPLESFLYEYTPAAVPSLARFQVGTSGDGSPRVALLPATGHFDDLLAQGADKRLIAKTSAKYYVVLFDLSGEIGSSTLRPTSLTLTAAAPETEGNNTPATANTLTLPAFIDNATLSSDTDEDWFKFASAAGDSGKKNHVLTLPGDDFTDTVVDVKNGAGAVSLGGPSSDAGYHEDFTSSVIAASTNYTVQVTASSEAFDVSENHYTLVVFLE